MSQYRTRNRTVGIKIETTPGADSVPAVATDAIAAIAPTWSGGPALLPNEDEVTGTLDAAAPIPGGGGRGFAFGLNFRGSGTAATPPEYDVPLRAAGFARTDTAADVVGSAAGGTTTTITLAAPAGTTVDQYVGMIIDITSGTGSGQTRVITGYSAGRIATVTPAFTTAPASGSGFAIRANQLYAPASANLPNVSIYDYMHRNAGNSRLERLLGAALTMACDLPVRGIPRFQFSALGKYVANSDVAKPANPTLDTTRPRPVIAVDCALGGVVTRFNRIQFACNNTLAQADDPADAYGVDVASIVGRRIAGSINPPKDLLSVRNIWADFLDGTERSLWIRWGTAAGNRHSILFPRVVYSPPADVDNAGFLHDQIDFQIVGQDTGVYICHY
jgi:hypothetical protein